MNTHESRFVQLMGTKGEDISAWWIRVKAYMTKQRVFHVFKVGTGGEKTDQFKKNEETAHNELVNWLGNRFVKLVEKTELCDFYQRICEAHAEIHPRLTEMS